MSTFIFTFVHLFFTFVYFYFCINNNIYVTFDNLNKIV